MQTVAGMSRHDAATPGDPASDARAHRPVLLHPLIQHLQPQAGQTVVDGTLGGGGVTAALADRVRPGGRVIAIDRDPDAVAAAARRFAADSVITVRHGDFAELDHIARDAGAGLVGAVALDLGVSSMQIDTASRGFSFMLEGPLDMRMDPSDPETAAAIVNSWDEHELATLLRDLGGERFSRSIARAIVRRRERGDIITTGELRRVVEAAVPRRAWPARIHPATKTFQALRIAVNRELERLEQGLQAAIRILRPGGRLGVISFHSLEDTLVKNTLHVAAQTCTCPPQQSHCTCAHRATLSIITRKVIRPDAAELAANPRARSARLRVAEKLTGGT
ncbi:MAG TPA: 16S rRNA (cytosine(1402)-N(4))-methyltransferase RsmH [Dehalococcoidia bacterium]|nr:16S rRNA (cytosine(1402)-N(4))-methyltransferase RsmH [Dehalococcoidia bacterium]